MRAVMVALPGRRHPARALATGRPLATPSTVLPFGRPRGGEGRMPKGKKKPRRFDKPHGNQTMGTYEKRATKELDAPPIIMQAINELTGRKVPSHALVRNLRNRSN